MSEERVGTESGEGDDLDEIQDEILEELDEAEGEDPQGEPEPEGSEGQQPEPQPRQPSRAERRIAALRKDRREQAEEIRRLRQQQDQMLSQTRQPPPQPDPYRQAEIDRQETERVALMAPHEVAAYYANRSEQRVQQQLARLSVENADRLDRISYENFSASRPAAQRMATEVETVLSEARQAGMNPTRQAVYHLLLGRQVD